MLYKNKFGVWKYTSSDIQGGMSGRKGIIKREPTVDVTIAKIEAIAKKERLDKAKHEREMKQLREVEIRNNANRDRQFRGFVGVITDDHQDRSAYVDGDITYYFNGRTPRYVPSRHGAIHARTSNNTVHHLIPRNVIKEDD